MITRLHSLSHNFSQLFYITHTMTGYRSLLYKSVTFSPPSIITILYGTDYNRLSDTFI